MAISQGSTVAIEYIKETTIGTTPGPTPQTILVPYTSFGMEYERDMFVDPSRNADNQQRFMSAGAYRTSGSLGSVYQHGQQDDFLAGALMGTWATNVLKISNTKQGFTFGEWDSVMPNNRVFTGCEMNTLALDVPFNNVVTMEFGMVGRAMTTQATQLDSTPTAILTGKNPFTHVGGFVKLDAATAYTTSIKLNINNNIGQLNVLGQNSVYDSYLSQKSITGTITLVYSDNTFYTKFMNGTAAALEFQLSDGTNSHTWKLPNIKFSKMSAATDAGVRMLQADFTALYDSTLGAILSITRT